MTDNDQPLDEFHRGLLGDAHSAMMEMRKNGIKGYAIRIEINDAEGAVKILRTYRKRTRTNPAQFTHYKQA